MKDGRDYFFANGRFLIVPKTVYRVAAFHPIRNEDWKTALARKQRTIEVGEQGSLLDVVQNYFGVWAYVRFDNIDFNAYAAFSNLNYLGNPDDHH